MRTRVQFLRTVSPLFITTCVIIIVVAVFLSGNALIDIIELKTYDFRLISRGRIDPSPTVLLAVIDEKSLKTEGRWPWPRTRIADLVNILSGDGAKVIAFDVGFFEPDVNDQMAILDRFERDLDSLGIDSPGLAALIDESRKTMNNDLVLAEAIRNSAATVVLGYFFHMNAVDLDYRIEPDTITQQLERISGSKYPLIIYEGDEKDAEFIHADVPEANLDVLARSTDAAGFFSVKNDRDGVVRWMPLVIECRQGLYPPLAVASVYHYLDKPPLVVEVAQHGISGIRMGRRFIPTDEMGQLLINYLGPPKTFSHISISDILGGRLPDGTFRDKIVVIGATMGTYDLRSTSITPLYPGLEIHATVIDNILTENFLVKPGWALIYDLMAIIVVAAASGYALPRLGALQGALFTVALFYVYIFLAYWLLADFKLWLNIVYPLLALLLNYTGIRVHSYITRDRERKKIKETFKQYAAPLVIEEMMKDPAKLKLGGEERELTVLFNDLQGFTSLSERYPPSEMIGMLSNYFEKMTGEIFRFRGTLQTYIGDEIMAIFGAPIQRMDHAEKACDAALAMRVRLTELHAEWANSGHAMLTSRTGINTGSMLVGNLGCKYRFLYGVLGDNVNLGSRLEGLNKVYNTEILISGSTADKVRNSFQLREIDMVRAKGKATPVKIYELLTRSDTSLPATQEEANELYAAGLAAYRQKAWREALAFFNSALAVRRDDGPARTMAARCRMYLETPPEDHWDGVFDQVYK